MLGERCGVGRGAGVVRRSGRSSTKEGRHQRVYKEEEEENRLHLTRVVLHLLMRWTTGTRRASHTLLLSKVLALALLSLLLEHLLLPRLHLLLRVHALWLRGEEGSVFGVGGETSESRD